MGDSPYGSIKALSSRPISSDWNRRAMAIAAKILENIRDIPCLGPRFAARAAFRLLGQEQMTIDTPAGPITMRLRESDPGTVRQVFRNREYDVGIPLVSERIRSRLREILQCGKTPVVIDAGANIGAAALWLAHEYKGATVVAVEPDPANAEMARTNLASVPSARLIEAALGSRPGFVSIVDGPSAAGRRTLPCDKGCPMMTIDQLVKTVPQGELLLVKVDIEGFEADLFSDNTEWLDQAFAVMIEPHDWMLPGQHSSQGFQREIARRSFELFISGENLLYVRV